MSQFKMAHIVKKLRKFCVIFVMCCVLVACADNEDIYSGLSIRDANEMVALLRKNNIEALRAADGTGAAATTFKISVPKVKFADSVDILRQHGYPRETFKSIAEVFPGEGLVVSPLEQRARYSFAIGQELSRTLSQIEGVLKARVHIVMADPDARVGAPSKASASVSITHKQNSDIADLGPKIRLIVTNSVQGLHYNDVSISFFLASPEMGGGAPSPSNNSTLNMQAPAVAAILNQQIPDKPSANSSQTPPSAREMNQRSLITEDLNSEKLSDKKLSASTEVVVPETSSFSWTNILQYLAAALAVLGGVLYIRRVMRNAGN